MNLGLTFNYAGQAVRGLATCEYGKTLPDSGQWISLCIAEAQSILGNEVETVTAAENALVAKYQEDMVVALAALALARVGHLERAADILVQLRAASESRYVSPLSMAYAQFSVGNDDGFFHHVNLAIDEKATFTPWVVNVPHFERLHDDPRFAAIVERIDLPKE